MPDLPQNWTSLTDSVLVNVFESLGRSGSVQAMRGSRCLYSAGKSVKTFWQRAVFVEEGHTGDMSKKLQQRLSSFAANHGGQVEEMALRNTAVAPFWKQAGESLLRVNDLQRCFKLASFTNLQRLILHSFKSQEIMSFTSNNRCFPKLRCLELLQCCLDSTTFSELEKFPALSKLGIWGLKNTQIALPDIWPSFHLDELCLDPVEANSWPGLGDLLRLHLRTSRPRLALAALPASLQVLSLTTSAQDVSNPFVEAFVLLDEHVQTLLPALPLLVDLVLSGHMKLGPCSISSLAEQKLIRLGLAKCMGLDSDKGFQTFMSCSWSTLETFEMPGNKHFKLEEISHLFPTLKICKGDSMSLVPQAGQSLEGGDQGEASWWEEVIDSRRPSVGFAHSSGVAKMNSPLGSLAHISHFLQQPGDFGEVCRGP